MSIEVLLEAQVASYAAPYAAPYALATRGVRSEVKATTGRLRPDRLVLLEPIREAGGASFVARDLRDVMQELASIQHKENKR